LAARRAIHPASRRPAQRNGAVFDPARHTPKQSVFVVISLSFQNLSDHFLTLPHGLVSTCQQAVITHLKINFRSIGPRAL
jgi:hypothetical protein